MSAASWLKDKADWLRNEIYNISSFAWLAQISTSRAPWKAGMLPTVGTLLMLLLAAGAMSGTIWVGTALWAGAFAKASAFLPILSETVLWVLGTTVVHFWFSRDINKGLFSVRDDSEIITYSEKTNPTKLYKLVTHITAEVNEHFRMALGDKHRPVPVPTLFAYNNNTNEIDIMSFGRNPGKTGLFFPIDVFNFTRNNIHQRRLAALIEKEIVKIYLNRGFYRMLASIGSTLANTLSMMSTSDNILLRAIGFLTGPMQFVLLLEKAINRSFEYEAAGHVIECFRGPDLIEALDCGVNPFHKSQGNAELKAAKKAKQRAPYTGSLSSILRPFTDWVDRNEPEEYDKTGSRFLSALDLIVGELTSYVRELFMAKPRVTNEKNYIRPNIKNLQNANLTYD
ncbi:MAG: hypothetical protein AB7V32_01665, partial [Candidatus Berkiella sp.]